MTRRERLMATLRGEAVDRPAVSFYEIGGFAIDAQDPDPFNIYNDPSWQPLLRLAEEETDLIRMAGPSTRCTPANCRDQFFTSKTSLQDGNRYTRTTLRVGGRSLTSLTRRDPAVNTIWTIEHLLKDQEDVEAYLQLPDTIFAEEWDVANLVELDRQLGERGVVMVDTADPICHAASLFSMEDYTVIAFGERRLFHQLLEKLAQYYQRRTEQVAREFPGHLWRVVGPEYATEPFLPPELFEEYVVRYTGPMIAAIQRHGGFARLHCHGRIRSALPYFIQMGPAATDPVEPPPQGDITLAEVRRQYGRDLVLFGNLEVADLENLPPDQFEKVVARTLREGTEGPGKGFVLMPTAAPYGRQITPTTLANYETMVRLCQNWRL